MTQVDKFTPVTGKMFILRIVASAQTGRAGEKIPVNDVLTIGRDPGCSVVLVDPSVSRQHARVESTGEGIKVSDLDSGNGVWVGPRQVSDSLVAAGEQFRVGSTIFECLEDPEAERSGPPARSVADGVVPTDEFVLRIVEGGDDDSAGQEFVVRGGAATIGRSPNCSVVLKSRDISRRHARIELTDKGFRVEDLDSTSGVWMGTRALTREFIQAGDRFRLGSRLVLECQSPDVRPREAEGSPGLRPDEVGGLIAPAAPRPGPSIARSPSGVEQTVSERDFDQTVVMPVMPQPLIEDRRIDHEGELHQGSAQRPFFLDDPTSAFLVVEGGILIFAVAATGTRTHFLGVLPGQALFGFDLRPYSAGSGFLAVVKQGTTVRRIQRARLQELASNPAKAPAVAELLDTWIGGLSKALITNAPTKRVGEVALRLEQRLELDGQRKATATEGVVWVAILSHSLLFDDLVTLSGQRHALFPLTPYSWIQSMSDESGSLILDPMPTIAVVSDPALWLGLEVFHQAVCACALINEKLETVDEVNRQREREIRGREAEEAAYRGLGSVLHTGLETAGNLVATRATEPVLHACRLIGRVLGIEVREPPGADDGLTFEERVATIAASSGFRTRVVALRDEWWTGDHGPLLGQRADTKDPIAILPSGVRSYECVDPAQGTRRRIRGDVAATLSEFAYAVYRPFPDGELSVLDAVRFGIRDLMGDRGWVVAMALVVGLFGTITPYITGQVFDAAIPQADRAALLGFGVALFVAALATSLFKLTQGVATVRIQAKMASALQAGVWDRMLNLPVNFFREFSAGDLADRAQGIEAIQELISGAGVAAILGSVSGLFYVAQMFGYNLRLALLAIGLTLTFVVFNMAANYLQLRYQRTEFRLRGRITGLVLNLLTGVTKLRVCGAERHAFRVWADQFEKQKKISFAIGSIQNVAAVFASIYPIIASIAIFYVVVGERQRIALSREPELTTGDFIAFNAAFALFLAAMQALGDASLSLLRVVPIYERLKPVLATQPEVDRSKVFPDKLKGDIELAHVHFRYSHDGPWIVRDLSLKIKRGEFVAFVGLSGSGKSTVLRLMLGFEQPTSGSVYYDGQDLSLLDLRLLRQQIGVVLQASRVMPTEIYRNIVGATSRTIEDAWEAAEKAGLMEDIRQMPMGMHTYVSEGGGTLSGGQRQRLMIARAIVNRPKIIFLDEATSALDNRTQSIVTESMDRMAATRVVIAHRLSTIIRADRICYLENGAIAEMGTYQELMDLNGLFAQLARRQTA